LALVILVTAAAVLLLPAAAGAAGLSIAAPATAGLGSTVAGSATTLTASLGAVTVVDGRAAGLAWIATVSSADFTTGSATSAETIGKASISYWSGGTTSTSGLVIRTPGQLTSVQKESLSVPRTAFSALGSLVSNSTSWNPTIVVSIPAKAIVGSYTGTITHSVA
jgi:hypothetical protein